LECDTPDDRTDDVADHRARVGNLLPEIIEQAKQALADANISLDLFFIVPSSGAAILTIGTVADPPDEVWSRTSEIVSKIVALTIGLATRTVACATTAEQGPLISPANWPAIPQPIPAPLATRAGADR